jgi:hypothetical protein
MKCRGLGEMAGKRLALVLMLLASAGFSHAAVSPDSSNPDSRDPLSSNPAPSGTLELVYLGDVAPDGGNPRRSDFVDLTSIARRGDIASIWTYRAFWPATARANVDAASVWHRFQFDCLHRTVMQTGIVVLDETMNTVARNERPEPQRSIVPQSSTEILAGIACDEIDLPIGQPRFASAAEAFRATRAGLTE